MPVASWLDMEKSLKFSQQFLETNNQLSYANHLNLLLNNDPNNIFANMLIQQIQTQNLRKKIINSNLLFNAIKTNSPLSFGQSNKQINHGRYKTELCRQFSENGECKYGEKCQFAHGLSDLKDINRHPKYKTDFCKTFHTKGFCPYGPRCHFIHEIDERSDISSFSSPNSDEKKTGLLNVAKSGDKNIDSCELLSEIKENIISDKSNENMNKFSSIDLKLKDSTKESSSFYSGLDSTKNNFHSISNNLYINNKFNNFSPVLCNQNSTSFSQSSSPRSSSMSSEEGDFISPRSSISVNKENLVNSSTSIYELIEITAQSLIENLYSPPKI